MADHEKRRKINATAFVLDFVNGASNKELSEKYGLTASQLARFVETLKQKELITSTLNSKRNENLKSRLYRTAGPTSPNKDHKVPVDLDTGLVLHCPSCGAPIKQGWENCKYCSAPLDFSLRGKTRICPLCFDIIAADGRFCMHCGRAVKDLVEEGRIMEDRLCPRCEIPMQSKRIDEFAVTGCDKCNGLFVPIETFEMLQDRMDRQIFPADGVRKVPLKWENTINYVKCPVCKNTMARTNFARTSGILIDICRGHGIWFDSGELEAVMLFISAHRQKLNFIDMPSLKGNSLEDALIGMLKNVQRDKETILSSSERLQSPAGLAGFVLTDIMEVSVQGKGRYRCPACHKFQSSSFKRCPECGFVVKWPQDLYPEEY